MVHKRIALITGANQGVGFEVARQLVADGVTVLIGSRNFERGQRAALDIGAGAIAIQIDVTDQASIAAAAERISGEFGRLDLLVNNAAIAHTRTAPITMEEFGRTSAASVVSIDEVRATWDTNVFGVLQVYQAMVPLLRLSSDARIVNVSSDGGSLTKMSDPTLPYRAFFTPGYAASKTALNAITLAMHIEMEPAGIKVNLVSPGYTSTALNNFEGTESLEDGAREVVRVARLGPDGANGTFTQWENSNIPW